MRRCSSRRGYKARDMPPSRPPPSPLSSGTGQQGLLNGPTDRHLRRRQEKKCTLGKTQYTSRKTVLARDDGGIKSRRGLRLAPSGAGALYPSPFNSIRRFLQKNFLVSYNVQTARGERNTTTEQPNQMGRETEFVTRNK